MERPSWSSNLFSGVYILVNPRDRCLYHISTFLTWYACYNKLVFYLHFNLSVVIDIVLETNSEEMVMYTNKYLVCQNVHQAIWNFVYLEQINPVYLVENILHFPV